MKYKIELKTNMVNDDFNRSPSLKVLKDVIDDYSQGNKGIVVIHDSFYDYNFDVNITDYDMVDSIGVCGHIINTVIDGGKLFIILDLNDDKQLNGDYICFYRAKFQNVNKDITRNFDSIKIIAIDLITITQVDNISNDKLSIIEPY